jgi:hypothetical protein
MDDHVGFMMSWGTLSFINAGLAKSQGRSGFVWWTVSVLMGPLATFLITVLPPSQ